MKKSWKLGVVLVCLGCGLARGQVERMLLSIPRVTTPVVLVTNWTTNTWTFTGSISPFVDAGANAGISAVYTNDGGALYFTNFVKAQSGLERAWMPVADPGESWVTWGVPVGATVIGAKLVSMDWKLASATKLSSHTNRVDIISMGGASLLGGYLINSNMPIVTGGWSNISVQPTLVVVSPSPSATEVRVVIYRGEKTGTGSGGANVQFGVDNLKLGFQWYTNAP